MKRSLSWVVAAQGLAILKLWWRGPNPERVALSLRVDRLAAEVFRVDPAFVRLNARFDALDKKLLQLENRVAALELRR